MVNGFLAYLTSVGWIVKKRPHYRVKSIQRRLMNRALTNISPVFIVNLLNKQPRHHSLMLWTNIRRISLAVLLLGLFVGILAGIFMRSPHDRPVAQYVPPGVNVGERKSEIVQRNRDKKLVSRRAYQANQVGDSVIAWEYVPENKQPVVYDSTIEFHVREEVSIKESIVIESETKFLFDNFDDPPSVFLQKAKIISKGMGARPDIANKVWPTSRLPSGKPGVLSWSVGQGTKVLRYYKNTWVVDRSRSWVNKYFGSEALDYWPISLKRPDSFLLRVTRVNPLKSGE